MSVDIAGGGPPGIDALWSSRRDAHDPGPETVAVVPDGCIDLIWRVVVDAQGDAREGALLIAGPDTRARQVPVAAGVRHVGVRMLPGWARHALGVDPIDLVDQVIGAEALAGRFQELRLQLETARDESGIRRLLGDAVARGLRPPPARVLRAVEGLGQGLRVEQVASDLGMSPRALQRLLHEWTGHAPKTLGRILRFHSAWRQLHAQVPELAALAMVAGYSDQAHMTREFATFGVPPPARTRVSSAVRFVQDSGCPPV